MEEKPLSAKEMFDEMASELMQAVDTGKISMETAEKIVATWEANLHSHRRLATEQLEQQYSGLPDPNSPRAFFSNLVAAYQSYEIDAETYFYFNTIAEHIFRSSAPENQAGMPNGDDNKGQQHHDDAPSGPV